MLFLYVFKGGSSQISIFFISILHKYLCCSWHAIFVPQDLLLCVERVVTFGFSSCLQLFKPNYFHISYRRGDHWCGRHGSRGSQENQFCEKITKYFVNTVLFNLRKPAFARKCALQYILSRFNFFIFKWLPISGIQFFRLIFIY